MMKLWSIYPIHNPIKKAVPEGNGLEEESSIHHRFPTLALTRSGSKGCLYKKDSQPFGSPSCLLNGNGTLHSAPCQLAHLG